MYGNGAMIGRIVIIIRAVQEIIQRDLPAALTACFVAVVGATLLTAAGWQIVATLIPTAVTTTWVSALSIVQNRNPSCFE